MAFDYDSWLKAARDRLETLKRQREAIDTEISKLEQGIEGFSPLVHDPGSAWTGPDVGLTAAVRGIFKRFSKRFLPTEIRDELLNIGVSLNQQNPMAAIHQILARLIKNGEVEGFVVEGRTHYQAKVKEQPEWSK